MNCYGSDDSGISFTGERTQSQDSVYIAYDDLRIVNSKLVELEYEKEINSRLKSVIANDSIIIESYERINNNISKECKRYVRERNICFGVGAAAIVGTILTLIFK